MNQPVDVDILTDLLGPATPWRPIEVVETTGSTNEDLMARAGAPHGLVRIAGHQSAGRGRFDRVWQSAPGAGVAVSVVVRPTQPVERWGWLPLLTGMAVAAGVRDLGLDAGCDASRVGLKWPNDVLIDDAKICGVLAQTDGEKVVLGWGLNIAMTAEELPVPTATSLALADWPTDATFIVLYVLQRLEQYYAWWGAGHDMVYDYTELSSTLGRQVRVERARDTIAGKAVGISRTGELIVDVDGYGTVAVEAGDVVHLKDGR